MHSPASATAADRFTWADYRTWPDDQRWELVNGVAHCMAPAPSIRHQEVAGALFSRIEQQLRGRTCRPFIAPTDVKLSDSDVVQPDILVVCDPRKLVDTHIDGAPDLVVEVLSPGTSARDLRQKKSLYERYAVREYLIVDPLEHYAIRFLLGEDGYDKGTVFAPDEVLTLATLDTVQVPLWEVFGIAEPIDSAAVDPASGR